MGIKIFDTAEENKKEEETCSSYKFHVHSNLKVLYAFSARNSLPLLSDSHWLLWLGSHKKNWFLSNIKVLNAFSARNGFPLLLNLIDYSGYLFGIKYWTTGSPAPETVTLETVDDLPRVLVLTSTKLLSLLGLCQGFVNGTFASMSKLWKQQFMFPGRL